MATQMANAQLDLDRLLAAFEPLVAVMELRFDRDSGDAATVEWSDGRLSLLKEAGACRVTLHAPSEAKLANMREAVGYYADQAGIAMQIDWQAGRPAGVPGNMTLAHVARSERLSPSFQRLRLAGDFARFSGGGPHFRLNFGPAGAGWPQCDETGKVLWPGGMQAWHRPPYTVRAIDPDRGWIDVDMVLHAGGRVTEWLSRCAVGDEVAVTGPGGKSPGVAGWVGYVGDETAMPVIAHALERLPPTTRGAVRLLVPDLRDRQALGHPPGVDVRWFTHAQGMSLAEAVSDLDIPAANRQVFVAGERAAVDRARLSLTRSGMAKSDYQAAAYWQYVQ